MIQEQERKILGFHRNVIAVGFVSLFMDISSQMIYPIVPLFLVSVIGANKATIGLIEGIAESTASILKVFSGWLSDRLGKRKLLMGLGYGVSVLSRPILAQSGTWGEVLTARLIDRFGKGVRTAPRDAIIADSAEHITLGRAFGLHRAMDTLGAVIGPGLAFLILYAFINNFRLVFWLSIIPGMVAVFLIIFFISEKARAKEELAKLPRLSLKVFDGRFRHYILVIVIFSIGNTSDAFLILRAENLGISREIIPITYLLFNVVYFSSSMPLGIMADRIGMKTMIAAGFLLYSLIYFGFAFATQPNQIWLLFGLYGIFRGISDGTQRAYLATLAPSERRATAFGIYHMAVGISLLPASIVGGLLWDRIGPEATFLFGSLTALVALIIFTLKKSPLQYGRETPSVR
ncbi:MAG: MFS transporter [Thermodesulfobacteriota bacterium]